MTFVLFATKFKRFTLHYSTFVVLGNVHTGVNFIDKVECCVMVRFVRITYVRPLDESINCRTMYSPPVGLSYKTFIPAAVKVGMCSGAPQYESFAATWERSKAWLKCVGWYGFCVIYASKTFFFLNSYGGSFIFTRWQPDSEPSICNPLDALLVNSLCPVLNFHFPKCVLRNLSVDNGSVRKLD